MPVTSDGYVVRVSRRNRQTPYETGIVSVTAFRSPKKNVHWTSLTRSCRALGTLWLKTLIYTDFSTI